MVKPSNNTRAARKAPAAFAASTLLAAALMVGAIGCSAGANSAQASTSGAQAAQSATTSGSQQMQQSAASGNLIEGSALDTGNMFTDRDLAQTADLADAQYITLASNQNVDITEEGVYVISGSANDVTITVNVADKDAKVQLVLDGASITNSSSPAIYVVSADKVFVTTTEGSANSLSVTGTFEADGETNTDAVIFSRADVVVNGLGTLNISSTDNGISSKDLLKVTGSTLNITSTSDALEANDGVAISGGTITIDSQKDAINAGDDDDATKGFVYISGGNLTMSATSQGINAQTIAQIDGGSLTINAKEGIEATYVQINDATLNISANDDGINATTNSTAYDVAIDIKGGSITIKMASGDTDALDSNGGLYISGGTIDITAQSPFDFDGAGALTGGTVTVNGSEVTQLTNQMMGGPGGGQAQGSGSMGPGGNRMR